MSSKMNKEKVKNRYFMEKEVIEKPTDSVTSKEKRNEPEEIVMIKPKKAHKEKKKIVSKLKSLQEILNTKPPDAEEDLLNKLVFSGSVEEEISVDKDEEFKVENKKRKPVWEDEDDEQLSLGESYKDSMVQKFKKIVGDPIWADLESSPIESDDDEDDFLKKTGNFVQNSEDLSKNFINLKKCGMLHDSSIKNSIVKHVEFHQTAKVALVASTSGILNLFQVDGKLNSKIQSIYFEDFPIHTAHFAVDGNEIIAGSNMHGFFYTYDMLVGKMLKVPRQKGMEQKNIRRFHMSPDGKYIVIHGRYGNIHLMTARTKEWIGTLKMNGEVVAIDFSNDGSKMYSHGDSGEVYIWDINSRRCLQKFEDEGSIVGTSIAVSCNNQFLATGSNCGMVNVYNINNTPTLVKTFKNLRSEITDMKFNNTTEILAISSSYSIGATRLIHVPSMSVFSNFPTREDYKCIKQVNSFDISPNSGFLMMGNNTGNALIYRLKHFKSY